MVRAIVGGNWGDEGKGKMTDLLAAEADIVVRFQGGANAGHTIINDYGKFVLHLLPSGVFRRNVINVIAPGVALNLNSLFAELDMLAKRGVPEPKLMISERTQLLMPYHIMFDRLEEERLGSESFGSTKSGIAPFYSDKCLKTGIQISELFGNGLREKIEKVCFVKNQVIKALYGTSELLNANSVYREIISWKEKIAPLIYDTTHYLNQVRGNKRILLEGQLGALRDIEHGIYPYVTSSSPLAGYGAVSTGIPPWSVTEIITVIKAYSSCVGAGIFVSEIYDNAADELRKRGGDSGEYGATTGRPRRMGWFDTVASRYGCMIQGTTEIALSMLDVLGYLEKIPVCVAYEIEGHTIDTFPVSYQLQKAKPVYEYLDGWGCDISGIGTYKALPPQARAYVEFIEAKLGLPVTMISNGPKRDDIIYRK